MRSSLYVHRQPQLSGTDSTYRTEKVNVATGKFTRNSKDGKTHEKPMASLSSEKINNPTADLQVSTKTCLHVVLGDDP